MSKTLPQLTEVTSLLDTDEFLVNASGNPRRVKKSNIGFSAGSGAPLVVNIRDYIASTEWAAIDNLTSTFDCYSALMAAIAALPSPGGTGGGIVYIPRGLYNISQTVQLKKYVHLIGEGAGEAGGWATRLYWPKNTTAIVINTGTTDAADGGGDASSTILEGLYIHGISVAGGSTSGSGIWLRARASIVQCRVEDFAEHGILVNASVGGSDLGGTLGNANNWYIEKCAIYTCGGHGVFCTGTDANAGVCIGTSAMFNDGWGFYDSSFLGNTWIGLHTQDNGAGPYKSDNSNARTVWLGCYSESGQPPSYIATGIAIGGCQIAGFDLSAGGRLVGMQGITPDTPFQTQGPTQGGSRKLNVLYGGQGFALQMWTDTDAPLGIGFWNETAGTFDIAGGISLTTALTALLDPHNTAVPAGKVVLPGDVLIHGQSGCVPLVYRLSAAPTTGNWNVGDFVYNIAPVSGGTMGWVCVTAGTPGTWKTWGPIS